VGSKRLHETADENSINEHIEERDEANPRD
jgi:hypothetical protein